MAVQEWARASEEDLPGLRDLAHACLMADGGLPLLESQEMLTRHFLGRDGVVGRDETGDIVAAAGLFADGSGRPAATGLVRPSARRQGLGQQLTAWVAEHSGGRLERIVVETVSPATDGFLTALGLHRVFAEHVMRHDLRSIPTVRRPEGVTTKKLTQDSAPLFFEAYLAAFAERPGFPDPPRETWIGMTLAEPGLRPGTSRVAVDGHGAPIGFVILADEWVDQVGVVPTWRGRRLGAHLVARSLTALQRAGCEAAWLAVNVDNPAHRLYLDLGFVDAGLRARYERMPTLDTTRGIVAG